MLEGDQSEGDILKGKCCIEDELGVVSRCGCYMSRSGAGRPNETAGWSRSVVLGAKLCVASSSTLGQWSTKL